MEEWRVIPDFVRYEVSNTGQVRNRRTMRVMRQSVVQNGHMVVGMMLEGVQRKASVAPLVARAFLPPHENPNFTTPIHLDGDRGNNHVDNLAWRSLNFAIAYYKQFTKVRFRLNSPIEDIESGTWFPNSLAAATYYGLLEADIAMAVYNETRVPPTYQMFRQARRHE